MPIVGLIRTRLRMILIHRDPHRARTHSRKMAGERAQRPRGDALHQRTARMVVARQLVMGTVGAGLTDGVYPPVIQRPCKPSGGPNQSKARPTTMPPVSA